MWYPLPALVLGALVVADFECFDVARDRISSSSSSLELLLLELSSTSTKCERVVVRALRALLGALLGTLLGALLGALVDGAGGGSSTKTGSGCGGGSDAGGAGAGMTYDDRGDGRRSSMIVREMRVERRGEIERRRTILAGTV